MGVDASPGCGGAGDVLRVHGSGHRKCNIRVNARIATTLSCQRPQRPLPAGLFEHLRLQGGWGGTDHGPTTGITGVDSLSPDYRSDELLLGVTVAQLSAGDAPTIVAFERVCAGEPTFDGI